jgi:hypothetical protein
LIKNTIQLFVINKKHTIQAKVHTVWKGKNGKWDTK